MFIKANFSFTYEGKSYNFINQHISVYGVAGLKWGLFDARTVVGEQTALNIELLGGNKERIQTYGIFSAERTEDSVFLGIKFILEPKQKKILEDSIKLWGTVPTTHVRKYPRIPADSVISTMPQQCIISNKDDIITTAVANISPSGILLSSENPKIALIEPGTRLRGQLEPRGDFYMAINFEGTVKRVIEERTDSKKNTLRYLGIQFNYFDVGHKEAFVALLQDVLVRVKIYNTKES